MQISLNRILLAFMATVLVSNTTVAQRENDQRTLSTKVADLLAVMPAYDEEQLNASMNEIASLGKEGLLQLTEMLSAEGDNTELEYALGGFSRYVTKPGREDLREMSLKAYCQALENAGDDEIKAFLIRQLGFVGNEEAVSCLQEYLRNDRLRAPAAKALVNINSENANQALLNALRNAQGAERYSLVNSLGETGYKAAVADVAPLVESEDQKLQRLALFALAKIADPASEAVLWEAAKKEDFVFGSNNATSSYLLYAQRLVEEGQQELAEKLAQRLLNHSESDLQVHTRTAALKLLADIQGEESVDILVKAAGDSNPEYRAAALKFAADHLAPSDVKNWVKKMKRSDDEVKAGIIDMLGRSKATEALPAIRKRLKSKNQEVKMAAIWAVGRMGDEAALEDLLKTLKKANPEEIAAIQESLLIMDVKGLTEAVADALPQKSPAARAALLRVLGSRADSKRIDEVFVYVEDEDATVRLAALRALENMADTQHLPRLFPKLKSSTNTEEISAIQAAITAAISREEDPSQQVSLVLEQMKDISAKKKPRYFAILSQLGGKAALEAVSSEFHSGNAATKAAAVEALSNWNDGTAAPELYRILEEYPEEEFQDKAFRGFVRAVSNSVHTDDYKVLELRKAMDLGKTAEQKRVVLREIGKLRTFPALVFVGEFLKEPALQQVAARSVMNIALSSDFYGKVVRDLLDETMQTLSGPESEYLKESIRKHLSEMPEGEGIVPLFNGKDLSGWKGLVADPIKRAKMTEKELREKQQQADAEMRESWTVENGELIFTGEGHNIATEKEYGDFEMFVDWKIYDDGHKKGDAGIYLRGTPQVQMWDTARVDVGAQVGSGGLYNNKKNPSKPLLVADRPLGEWNTFHIIMIGDRVTVYLNGKLVTDNVILENYWDRNLPIFAKEQIELQAHGSRVAYRDIYIREIPRPEPFELSAEEKKEGFEVLFDGTNMHQWTGNTTDYVIENGEMVVRKPKFGSGGNLFTKKQYDDFIFRFEFKLTPGANNGLGIRAPLEGDAAYEGIELQILDNDAPIYKDLKEYQYHGSAYGIAAAKRGALKPVGEWNYQEVIVNGPKIKVILNGNTILDTDLTDARENGPVDGKDHPGLYRETGHIGFLGHGSEVWFRNIRVKEIE